MGVTTGRGGRGGEEGRNSTNYSKGVRVRKEKCVETGVWLGERQTSRVTRNILTKE